MSDPDDEGMGGTGLARAIVRVGALLAPVDERVRLARQWEAELAHRRGRTPQNGRGEGLHLAVWALGIVPHALYLRRRRWGMGGWWEDLGQAWRAVRRRPGPALVAVGVLALGIGASTAVFSVAEAVLFRPLPFPEGERLVRVYGVHRPLGVERSSVSWSDFADMREADVLEDAAIYDGQTADLAGDGLPERVRVSVVDGSFFDVLGADALRGRLLGAGDDRPDAAPVVVLAHALWRSRYGGDPELVGRTVRLDGVPHTVVGILHPDHAWPKGGQVWRPLRWGPTPPERVARRDNHAYRMVARLAPGVDPATATRRLSEVTLRARADMSPDDRESRWEAEAVPLHRSLVSAETPRLVGLAALAVLAVLLIACMNVASLLLVEARRRVRELSLRSVLGADRVRLVRQVLAESVLIALTGGALGSAIALLGMRAAAGAAPAELLHVVTPRLSAPLLAGAVLLSLLAAGAAGLSPALRASRLEVGDALREGRGSSGSRERRRGQRALVVAELALTTVLLVASGLFLRSFQAELTSDPGFRADGLATFSIMLPEGRFDEPEAILSFRARAGQAFAALPGVRDVAITTTTPLGGGGLELIRAFLPQGAPEPPAGPEHVAQWVEADEAYFRTLGIPPLRGRTFNRDDGPESEPVMIVTEGLAELLVPGGDVIGMRVRSWRDENIYRTVVGVVPRPRISDIGDGTLPIVFVPASQSPRRRAAFILRVDGDPAAIAPGVRRVMAELDPDVAVPEIMSLEAVQRRSLAPLRFLVTLFSGFGAAALLLAVTGVYGLVAFSVATRTREIGIRMAIGATGGEVRGAVLREGAGLTALGLGSGVLAAGAFARVLGSVLENVAWLDAPTWAGVLGLLAIAAVSATVVPALRASRIDPVRTLGAE